MCSRFAPVTSFFRFPTNPFDLISVSHAYKQPVLKLSFLRERETEKITILCIHAYTIILLHTILDTNKSATTWECFYS